MSPPADRQTSHGGPAASADVFAALGDPTRLAMVTRLAHDGPMSLSRLTAGSAVTRQAVRKHLDVLGRAGLVQGARRGRESVWQLRPRRFDIARRYLDLVSRRWDDALERLRAAVER